MFNIGPLELMVILVIALLVVGPKRLPEVGRSIGRGLREFRKAQDEVRQTLRFDLDDELDQPAIAQPGNEPAGSITEPETPPNGEVKGELLEPGPTIESPGSPPPPSAEAGE